MEQLDKVVNPAQYKQFVGKTVLLGKQPVTVHMYSKESQSGSWERGFKWTTSIYGYLSKTLKCGKRFSPDHGKTWYNFASECKKQLAGKVLVEREKRVEFAFDAIQKINRDYDPTYRWKS